MSDVDLCNCVDIVAVHSDIDAAVCNAVESCSQLETMVNKHELLVQKLREECRRLVSQLEQVTSKYK